MALIKGKQLADTSILPAKIDLSQAFAFTGTLTSTAAPGNANDVVNKSYVDNIIGAGLDPKASVKAVDGDSEFDGWTYDNGTGTLTETPISLLNLTLDGVALSLNDRLLVQGQSTAAQNGIYTVTQAGDGAATPFVLTRASDFDASSDISANNLFFVEQGTEYGDTAWVYTGDDAPTLGTTALNFKIFSNFKLSSDDQFTASSVTAVDGDSTGIAISNTPRGMVQVLVNGLAVELGDAVKTADCYFSADAGVTAKAISAIANSDVLYWNQSVAGYNLDATDEITLVYESL